MIMIDENGEVIDLLQERNEDIKMSLLPFLEKILKEQEENKRLKSRPKLTARINTKLNEVIRKYGLKTEDEIVSLSYDEISDYYNKYMELMSWLNEDIDFTPKKTLFCAFMGITTRRFNKLAQSKDEEIKNLFASMNDYLVDTLTDSAMGGNASEKSALTLLSTKDFGQETVVNDFQATIVHRQEALVSPSEALSNAKALTHQIEQKMKNTRKKKK